MSRDEFLKELKDGALSLAQTIVYAKERDAVFHAATEYLAQRDAALAGCPHDDDCCLSTSEELDALLDPIDARFIAVMHDIFKTELGK